MHAALTDYNSSKLESVVSEEKHGGPTDPAEEEEIVTVPRRKGGKSGQYLYLLLVIFAIIASKSSIASCINHSMQVCMVSFLRAYLSLARGHTLPRVTYQRSCTADSACMQTE